MGIKNVIICGLGALGLTYANKLKDICNLRILANTERIEKYRNFTPKLNGKNIDLNYITPSESFNADLIIITTKSTGLNSAIDYIKNFVKNDTIIISLINGISSEDSILKAFPNAKILRSFFIGHSAMRINENVQQDGIGKIVLEPNPLIEVFFKKNNIDYEISDNIIYSQWIKLGVNIVLNELTAIHKCTVGDLRKTDDYSTVTKSLIAEIKQVAKAFGLKNLENYEKEVLDSINLIADDGKTSMYQDIIAGRKTEIDIFSGEIIKLAKIHNIDVPYNENLYHKIKDLEKEFS